MKPKVDARTERTRDAIIRSFNMLVLRHGHAVVSVGSIVSNARVGRSTFYEHFGSKDDVLALAADSRLTTLADSVRPHADVLPLERLLIHMQENARAVRSMLEGSGGAALIRGMACLLQERMAEAAGGRTPRIPLRLAAIHLAESQLSLVRAWLRGVSRCEPRALAEYLALISQQWAAAVYEDQQPASLATP